MKISDGQLNVYLVGRMTANPEGVGKFMRDIGAYDANMLFGAHPIVTAGRVCYMSYQTPRAGDDAAYVKRLLEMGHGSVLEHLVYSFIITGVSRSLTHELVRHRAGWSYSQRSQRYVDESESQFIMPPSIEPLAAEAPNDWVTGAVAEHHKQSCNLYRSLVATLTDAITARQEKPDSTAARKEARGAARCVLPNGTETMIYATVNARALRHFIELRASPHADAEIRRLAFALWRIVKETDPDVFSDYVTQTTDGIDWLETPYRKV